MTTEDPITEIEVPRTPAPKADARRWTLRRVSGLVAALAAVGTVLAGLTGYWTTYRTITRELFAPVKPGPTAPTEAAHFSIVVLPFAHLWADQFDTTRADLLQMQDEIVGRIDSTVRFELLKAEAHKSATGPDVLVLATRCAVSVVDKPEL